MTAFPGATRRAESGASATARAGSRTDAARLVDRCHESEARYRIAVISRRLCTMRCRIHGEKLARNKKDQLLGGGDTKALIVRCRRSQVNEKLAPQRAAAVCEEAGRVQIRGEHPRSTRKIACRCQDARRRVNR